MDLTITGSGRNSSTSIGRLGENTLTKERKMSNAIFRSTTNRFNLSYHGKDHGIRILKSTAGKRAKIVAQSEQGKHTYDKEAVFGIEN